LLCPLLADAASRRIIYYQQSFRSGFYSRWRLLLAFASGVCFWRLLLVFAWIFENSLL